MIVKKKIEGYEGKKERKKEREKKGKRENTFKYVSKKNNRKRKICSTVREREREKSPFVEARLSNPWKDQSEIERGTSEKVGEAVSILKRWKTEETQTG